MKSETRVMSSWALAFGVGLLSLVASCGSPLVGGACEADRVVCDGQCIDLDNDYENCGQCGNDCGVFVCAGGMCRDRVRPEEIMDGSVQLPDGSVVPVDDSGMIEPPDAGRDAEVPDSGDGDQGVDANTGLGGCGVGFSDCGSCVRLDSDLDHCGACDNACMSGDVCSSGSCMPACEDGLTRCSGTCFDVTSDARNCGGCGNVCASGICLNGNCADAVPGQLVVIGHDYAQTNRFQNTLLGNALFLARGAPVRTLVFEGSASQTSIDGAEAAIDFVAQSTGRAWEKVEALEPLLTFQLANADALLIHAQEGSSDSVLTKQGELWGMALVEFLLKGGVVVVLDGGSPRNRGAQVLLGPSSLFDAQGRERIFLQDLEIPSPGVGIALRVGAEYRGERNSVRFLDISTAGTPVSRDDEGHPVIYHRVIRP